MSIADVGTPIVDEFELTLFTRYVRNYIGAISRLDVSQAAKEHAFASGLRMYEPGCRGVELEFDGNRIDCVKLDHPKLGQVEIIIP